MEIIKPLSSHSISADFVQVYNKIMESTILMERNTPHRVLSLRPSQMPFCAVQFFVNHAKRGLYRELDLAGAFYTSVGTIVHEVMQKYLPQSGRFLADYHCKECDTWHRMSYKHECCGFPTQYHEIEIDYKGVKGHIDAVYRDKHGRLWILDFKTTSVAGAPSKKKNPGVVYVEQIEVYAVLIELQYGIKIEGIMDAFILRDNPKKDPAVWTRLMTDALRKKVRVRLTKYKKAHRDALDAASLTEALALRKYGRCANPYCKYCPKSDAFIKQEIKQAIKVGKANGNVPIREMAERELARIAKKSKPRLRVAA